MVNIKFHVHPVFSNPYLTHNFNVSITFFEFEIIPTILPGAGGGAGWSEPNK